MEGNKPNDLAQERTLRPTANAQYAVEVLLGCEDLKSFEIGIFSEEMSRLSFWTFKAEGNKKKYFWLGSLFFSIQNSSGVFGAF